MSTVAFPLTARQQRFKTYIFAFEQMLALKCNWLLHVSDNEFKTTLGYMIGYDGLVLRKVTHRLCEMYSELISCPSSASYAALFSNAVNLTEPSAIADFLYSIVGGITSSMTEYLELGEGIEDEPSLIVLQETLIVLARATQTLRRWLPGEQPTTIANITFSGEPSSVKEHELLLPPLPSIPARESTLRFHPKPDLHPEMKTYEQTALDREGLMMLLHFIYQDIEIVAMESCARNILEFRDMPLEFRLDMARQIWDEARHARFIRRRLEQMGARVGDYHYSLVSWKNYMSGASLAERLAIQQVVLEGNGIDAGVLIARVATENNDFGTAEVFQYQNMDETVHAGIGNKWLIFLVGQSYEQYEQFVLRMAEKIGRTIPDSAPLDIAGRLLSGYPRQFVDAAAKGAFQTS
jgi:uncharacterized ferritin-like protein (DUF455 family)